MCWLKIKEWNPLNGCHQIWQNLVFWSGWNNSLKSSRCGSDVFFYRNEEEGSLNCHLIVPITVPYVKKHIQPSKSSSTLVIAKVLIPVSALFFDWLINNISERRSEQASSSFLEFGRSPFKLQDPIKSRHRRRRVISFL